MSKDFDAWNVHKQQLDGKQVRFSFRERELWWCSLGLNVGFEQDGTGTEFDRPVLIVRKFNRGMFWGAALTSRDPNPSKPAARYFVPVHYDDQAADTNSYVIISQLRVLSAKRLIRREGRLGDDQFTRVVSAIRELLPL